MIFSQVLFSSNKNTSFSETIQPKEVPETIDAALNLLFGDVKNSEETTSAVIEGNIPNNTTTYNNLNSNIIKFATYLKG